MRYQYDYLRRHVTLTMSMVEFREIVEWVEGLDPRDGFTREMRTELDRMESAMIRDDPS